MLGQIIRHWGRLFVSMGMLIGILTIGAALPNLAEADSPHNTSNVYRFSNETMVEGASSQLVRNKNGVSMNVKTSDLPGGQAFTVWWVIFNDPGDCTGGECGEDDVFDFPELSEVSVCFATGHVVGNNGKGNFAASRKVGDDSGCLFGDGLTDASGAEIHLIVRSHGPVIPGEVDDQISSINGGCDTELEPGVEPTEAGECSDLQFAIHQP